MRQITLKILYWLFCLIFLMPFIALFVLSFKTELPTQFLITEIKASSIETLYLIASVLITTTILGTSLAFLTTFIELKYKNWLTLLIVLPLAFPPYLITMGWHDILDSFGPIQNLYRTLFNYKSRADYSFLNPKSFGGAVFALTLALYPYVFLSVKAFLFGEGKLIAVSLTLGANKEQTLRRITFKRILPALFAGLFLVAFETLNDIGVAKLNGVNTLPSFIMTLWSEQNNLGLASFVALILFILCASIVFLTTKKPKNLLSTERQLSLYEPRKLLKTAIYTFLLFPFIMACLIPLIYFLSLTLQKEFFSLDLKVILSSLSIALLAALLTTVLALLMNMKEKPTTLLALGYILPSSILAIGIISCFLFLENSLFKGKSFWLYGTVTLLIFGFILKFLMLPFAQIEKHKQKISKSLPLAARTLGAKKLKIFTSIELPLLKKAITIGFFLTLIESLKELPLSLLLRPIGVNTMSLNLFDAAERGALYEVAPIAVVFSMISLISALMLYKPLHHP